MVIKLAANKLLQKDTDSTLVTIIFLIVIQSCGIRFFNGQGILLSFIIIILLLSKLKIKQIKFFNLVLLTSLLIVAIQYISNGSASIKMLIFQIILLFEIILLFKVTKDFNAILISLDLVLKILFYHALVGYIIYLIAPFTFMKLNRETSYLTFLYIFYVIPHEGFARNTGILWEPGLLQLMLNLYLFFSIRLKRSIYLISTIILVIIFTFSTTGYLVLFVNIIFLAKTYLNKINILGTIVVIVLIVSFRSMVGYNITQKFNSTNVSGLIRLRDLLISIELIQEKPFIGHGIFDESYLVTKNNINYIEEQVLSPTYLESYGYMTGGYTNGLLGVFSWYGIPIGIFLYYSLYKNKFVDNSSTERVILFLILTLTFFSEPITYTSFFLLFAFSSIYYESRNLVIR